MVRIIVALLVRAAIGFTVLIFGRWRRAADIGFLLVVLSLGSCVVLPFIWLIVVLWIAGR